MRDASQSTGARSQAQRPLTTGWCMWHSSTTAALLVSLTLPVPYPSLARPLPLPCPYRARAVPLPCPSPGRTLPDRIRCRRLPDVAGMLRAARAANGSHVRLHAILASPVQVALRTRRTQDCASALLPYVALRTRRTQDCASALLPSVPRIISHHCLLMWGPTGSHRLVSQACSSLSCG